MIHHLLPSFRPPLAPAMVAHSLLVERPDGLLLVDSGFGADDLADPRRLGQPFRALTRPVLDPHETAASRIRELGLDPADVTDIVLTHLDLDHAGGIADSRRPASTCTPPSSRLPGTRASRSAVATSPASGHTAPSGSRTRRAATTGSASAR